MATKQVIKSLVQQTLVGVAPATKAPATRRTVSKTAAKPAAKVAAKDVQPFKYFLITGRPAAGASLQAFTAAWFAMAGIDQGKAFDKGIAVKVAGATAIAYHVKTGRMVEKDGQIKLSEGGKIHFAARTIDERLKAVWTKVLKTGKPDGTLIKNANCIGKI